MTRAGEPSGEEDPANEERTREKEQAEDRSSAARGLPRPRAAHPGGLRELPQARRRGRPRRRASGRRSGLVRELLPVVDNLERALASAEEGEQHLAEGVRLVHSELIAVLERNGVEQFDPAGERSTRRARGALDAREEGEPGVVLDVVEKGYRSNGTVLRPARVVVSG